MILKKITFILLGIFIVVATVVIYFNHTYRLSAERFVTFEKNINIGLPIEKVWEIAKNIGFEYVVVLTTDNEEILSYSQYKDYSESSKTVISERYYFRGVLYNYDYLVSYGDDGVVVGVSGDK